MIVGKRIRHFRLLKKMTQSKLGQKIGFSKNSADARIAQYETGSRKPKADVINRLSLVLNISPLALNVPNIDSIEGLMHTFFVLEDMYGLNVGKINHEPYLYFDIANETYPHIKKILSAWSIQAEKLRANEIGKEEYDAWRYNYPQTDITPRAL